MFNLKYYLILNFFFITLPSFVFAQNTPADKVPDSKSITDSVIGTILSIFRDDNTALYIAGSMIVIAVILIIDYRQRISVPVIQDLKNINNLFSKTYNSETFSENIEDIKENLQRIANCKTKRENEERGNHVYGEI